MKKVINILTSMRVAIVLIIIISTISIIGAIIPQNKTADFYSEKYGQGAAKLIMAVHFNRIFASFYFIALILFLSLSLALCTAKHIPPVYAVFTRPSLIPDEGELRKENLFIEIDRGLRKDDVKTSFSGSGFRVFERVEKERIYICGRKGLISRSGFILTHLGLLVIILGGALGGFTRKSQDISIFEGETALVTIKSGSFAVRADKIEEKTDPNSGSVISDITGGVLLKDGVVVKSLNIEVNKPLDYGGISIFQEKIGTLRGLGLAFLEGDSFSDIKEKIIFYAHVKGDDFEKDIFGKLGDSVNVNENIVIRFDDFYSNFQRASGRDTNNNPVSNPCLTYTVIESEKLVYQGFAFLYHPSIEIGKPPFRFQFLGIEPADKKVHLFAVDTPFPVRDGEGGVIKLYEVGKTGEARFHLIKGGSESEGVGLYDGCPVKITDGLYAVLIGSKKEEYSVLRVEAGMGFNFFLWGAIVMSLGIYIMIFIRYNEIKVLIEKRRTLIGGKSNRIDKVFDRDFRKFVLSLKDRSG
jgi:preprotein translocase subunit SecG